MTNRLLLVFAALFIGTFAAGQITIDNSTLPDIGDVIEYRSFTNFEDSIDFKATGENLTWTYKNFNFGPNFNDEFLDIETTNLADTFPNANMVFNLAGFTVAADRTENEINILGAVINGFGGFEFNINSIFDEEFTYRTTPFDYNQSHSDQFEVKVSFASDLIPGLDTLTLPIPGVVLDSIRITTISFKDEVAEAHGTLNLLGNEFDVLKIKQTDSVETVLELGITSIFGFSWINGSLFLGDALDNFNRKVTTYKFLTNGSKASLLEIVDNSFIDTLGIPVSNISGRLSADIVSDVADFDIPSEAITIYPNPTTDYIQMNHLGDNAGQLGDVTIFNALGQRVLQKFNTRMDRRFDVSRFEAGKYFVKMLGKKGQFSGQFIKK